MAYEHSIFDQTKLNFGDKLQHMPWLVILVLLVIAGTGVAMLYSAAGGDWQPWAGRQLTRFIIGAVAMLIVALIDIRLWLKYAYLLYAISLALLVGVEMTGTIGGGAQRWLNLGFFQLQPSEVVKLTTILALARYLNSVSYEDIGRLHYLLIPIGLVTVPAALIMRQPDLGTAVMLMLVAAAILFLAGVRIWVFIVATLLSIAVAVAGWLYYLHDYQKERIMTFLDPEASPRSAGYHIIQSKIALGSGGVFGKGYMAGTQTRQGFVPEKHTDFIFTMIAEDFGLVGCLALLGLYILLFTYGFRAALRCRNQFGRLLGLGVTVNFFLYVFINIAMVIGLIPVVGVPLPLVSFGGSAMLTVMIGFGLLFCVSIHKDVKVGRTTSGLEG